MQIEFTADLSAEKEHRVERHPRGAVAHGVQNADQANWLDLNTCLFEDFFDDHFNGRVTDVAVARRVEPHTGVGSLNQEQLTLVVRHGSSHGQLGRYVASSAGIDSAHPLVDVLFGLVTIGVTVVRVRLNVAGDVQDLFESLPLVLALGKCQARLRNAGQRFGPASKGALASGFSHDLNATKPLRNGGGENLVNRTDETGVESTEFAVERGGFVETHRVDAVLEVIDVDTKEGDTPLPVVQTS